MTEKAHIESRINIMHIFDTKGYLINEVNLMSLQIEGRWLVLVCSM